VIKGTLTTSDRLKAIAAQVANPVALYKDAGRRVANDLRKHFVRLDGTQSAKHGGRSTHFWLDVRASTGNPDVDPHGATVTISDLRFAQKLYGGTINAKNGRALTIPIDPRAHGRRASVFEDEMGVKLFRPLGKRVLMAEIDGEVLPIYALASSVTQEAERDALPPIAELEAAVADTAEKHLRRAVGKG